MTAEMVREGPATITIRGEVLWKDHAALEHILAEAAEAEGANLVVDLHETTFIFSSALALMIAASGKALEQGRQVKFMIPSNLTWVAAYLQQTGPARQFEIEIV